MKDLITSTLLKKPFVYLSQNFSSFTMREPTVMDEIAPYEDPRVKKNERYAIIIKLARVTTFEGQETTNTKMIEKMPAVNLNQLMDKYNSFFPEESEEPPSEG